MITATYGHTTDLLDDETAIGALRQKAAIYETTFDSQTTDFAPHITRVAAVYDFLFMHLSMDCENFWGDHGILFLLATDDVVASFPVETDGSLFASHVATRPAEIQFGSGRHLEAKPFLDGLDESDIEEDVAVSLPPTAVRSVTIEFRRSSSTRQ